MIRTIVNAVDSLLVGTGLDLTDLGRILAIAGFVFATIHLITILITRWGDHLAMLKAFLFSFAVHIFALLFWWSLPEPFATPVLAEDEPDRARTKIQLEVDSPIPSKNSADKPVWERMTQPNTVEMARSEKQEAPTQPTEKLDRQRQETRLDPKRLAMTRLEQPRTIEEQPVRVERPEDKLLAIAPGFDPFREQPLPLPQGREEMEVPQPDLTRQQLARPENDTPELSRSATERPRDETRAPRDFSTGLNSRNPDQPRAEARQNSRQTVRQSQETLASEFQVQSDEQTVKSRTEAVEDATPQPLIQTRENTAQTDPLNRTNRSEPLPDRTKPVEAAVVDLNRANDLQQPNIDLQRRESAETVQQKPAAVAAHNLPQDNIQAQRRAEQTASSIESPQRGGQSRDELASRNQPPNVQRSQGTSRPAHNNLAMNVADPLSSSAASDVINDRATAQKSQLDEFVRRSNGPTSAFDPKIPGAKSAQRNDEVLAGASNDPSRSRRAGDSSHPTTDTSQVNRTSSTATGGAGQRDVNVKSLLPGDNQLAMGPSAELRMDRQDGVAPTQSGPLATRQPTNSEAGIPARKEEVSGNIGQNPARSERSNPGQGVSDNQPEIQRTVSTPGDGNQSQGREFSTELTANNSPGNAPNATVRNGSPQNVVNRNAGPGTTDTALDTPNQIVQRREDPGANGDPISRSDRSDGSNSSNNDAPSVVRTTTQPDGNVVAMAPTSFPQATLGSSNNISNAPSARPHMPAGDLLFRQNGPASSRTPLDPGEATVSAADEVMPNAGPLQRRSSRESGTPENNLKPITRQTGDNSELASVSPSFINPTIDPTATDNGTPAAGPRLAPRSPSQGPIIGTRTGPDSIGPPADNAPRNVSGSNIATDSGPPGDRRLGRRRVERTGDTGIGGIPSITRTGTGPGGGAPERRFDIAGGLRLGTPTEGLSPDIGRPEFAAIQDPEAPPLPPTYRLRNLARRGEEARKRGGNDDSERAVELSLKFLSSTQHPDGYWDADEYGSGKVKVDENGTDRRNAGARADTGITALALLAFLGAGYTHEEGQYAENIDKAIDWLISQQEETGFLGGEASHYAQMYCHGMATYALAEAYGMQSDPTIDTRIKEPLRKAIDYIIKSQNKVDGGWRYYSFKDQQPQKSDMSMFGWQLMALKSADIAGIKIPDETRQQMILFLRQRSLGPKKGLAGYRLGEPETPSMTAEALFSKQMLGIKRGNPSSVEAVKYLSKRMPRRAETNVYYWYYGTLAMYQYGGEPWRQWNDSLRDLLVQEQVTEGPNAGSWEPIGPWGPYGGRIYSTALSTLCLEVYYRFLPLYQQGGRFETDDAANTNGKN